MALLKPEPGELLSAKFDTTSTSLKTEMKAFEERLQLIKKKQGIERFLIGEKREGKLVLIKVIAASGAQTGLAAKEVAAAVKAKVGWGPKPK